MCGRNEGSFHPSRCEEGADFVSRGAQLPQSPAERELFAGAGSPTLCGPLKEARVAPFSPRREGQRSAHGAGGGLLTPSRHGAPTHECGRAWLVCDLGQLFRWNSLIGDVRFLSS